MVLLACVAERFCGRVAESHMESVGVLVYGYHAFARVVLTRPDAVGAAGDVTLLPVAIGLTIAAPCQGVGRKGCFVSVCVCHLRPFRSVASLPRLQYRRARYVLQVYCTRKKILFCGDFAIATYSGGGYNRRGARISLLTMRCQQLIIGL